MKMKRVLQTSVILTIMVNGNGLIYGQDFLGQLGAAIGREIRNDVQNSGNPQAIREFNQMGAAIDRSGLNPNSNQHFKPLEVRPQQIPGNNQNYPQQIPGYNQNYPQQIPGNGPYYPQQFSNTVVPNRVVPNVIPSNSSFNFAVPSISIPSISNISPTVPTMPVVPNSLPSFSSSIPIGESDKVKPKSNDLFIPKSLKISGVQQEKSIEAMRKKALRDFENVESELMPKADITKVVAGLPEPYDTELKQKLLTAVLAGDRIGMSGLPEIKSPLFESLKSQMAAREAIYDLKDKVRNGKASDEDFRGATNIIKSLVPASRADKISSLIDILRVKNQIIDLLDKATPGTGIGTLPSSSDFWVIHVPSMPIGTIIDLGNGAYMVGVVPTTPLSVQTGSFETLLGAATYSEKPFNGSDVKLGKKEILIRNSIDATFAYSLNGSPYTMQANYEQSLDGSTPWTITYDQGGGKGTKTEQLVPGIYEITTSPGYWAIQRIGAKIEINNSSNAREFNYLVDGVQHTISGHGKANHSSDTRISIVFDDGSGQVKRKTMRRGVVYVGLVHGKNEIDLFTESIPSSTATPGAPTPSAEASNLFGP